MRLFVCVGEIFMLHAKLWIDGMSPKFGKTEREKVGKWSAMINSFALHQKKKNANAKKMRICNLENGDKRSVVS